GRSNERALWSAVANLPLDVKAWITGGEHVDRSQARSFRDERLSPALIEKVVVKVPRAGAAARVRDNRLLCVDEHRYVEIEVLWSAGLIESPAGTVAIGVLVALVDRHASGD